MDPWFYGSSSGSGNFGYAPNCCQAIMAWNKNAINHRSAKSKPPQIDACLGWHSQATKLKITTLFHLFHLMLCRVAHCYCIGYTFRVSLIVPTILTLRLCLSRTLECVEADCCKRIFQVAPCGSRNAVVVVTSLFLHRPKQSPFCCRRKCVMLIRFVVFPLKISLPW